MIRQIALLLGFTALTGCAGDQSRYPSLEIRDVERASGTIQPVGADGALTADIAPAPSADTIARVMQLAASARAVHVEFAKAQPRASRLVAAGGRASTESDGWASAQVALSDLESIRSRVTVSLADIESLYVDARLEAQQFGAITSARSEVLEMIAQEDAALARLRGQMLR